MQQCKKPPETALDRLALVHARLERAARGAGRDPQDKHMAIHLLRSASGNQSRHLTRHVAAWDDTFLGFLWSLFVRRTLPKRGAIVVAAAIALSLASCGRRGPLEPPPGAPASNAPLTGTPGGYEAPANPGELAGQNTATSSGAEAPAAAKQPPRHAPKPFFLDPLL